MKKIREIIRLHFCHRLSRRQIAGALGVSRPVVSQYITRFKEARVDVDAMNEMNDDALLALLQGKTKQADERYDTLEEMFEYIASELKRVGVTLKILWEEYREKEPEGYGYTQFCHHYRIWRAASDVSMHIEHKAGDKLFVDFAGKKLSYIDRLTGEVKETETFVAILGASQLTYVEIVESQKQENFVYATENALRFIGGVPNAIVPDCLKSAVTKASKNEPELNRLYSDFAEHYDTVVLPARPAKPKDKALVENAVNIMYSRIYAALRNRVFYSLAELNDAVKEELAKHNDAPLTRMKVSRRQQFDALEKNILSPLPTERYVFKHFAFRRVQFNYHIYLPEDKHYYSVPYRYKGRKVEVAYTAKNVEIYHNHERIAFHKRDSRPHVYTTRKEDMPHSHQWVSEWSPDRFIGWAKEIGSATENIIRTVLATKKHPEQGYKVCLGILNLAKKYSNERLEKACGIAFSMNYASFKGIKNILENNLENEPTQQNLFLQLPEHTNIRGEKYYKTLENENEQPSNNQQNENAQTRWHVPCI